MNVSSEVIHNGVQFIIDFIIASLKDFWNEIYDESSKEFLKFLLLITIVVICLIIVLKLVEGILWTKDKFEETEYVPKKIRIACPKCKSEFYALQDAYMMCEYCQSIIKISRYYTGLDGTIPEPDLYVLEDNNEQDAKGS
mgnify:CR=1 FL=1